MTATTAPASEWDYCDHVAALQQQNPALATAVAGFTGIRSVLEWMQQTGRAKARVDIVGQDEFHYDFMIEMEPGGNWLVFGVT